MDITEALLTKMIESCGKISKLTRPVDPTTQLPAVRAHAFMMLCVDYRVPMMSNYDDELCISCDVDSASHW